MSVHRRLDQILQSKGQVSERQIREALIKQSMLGGRLGEHLIRQGQVCEADLVEALSEQYGLPGVCLTGLEVEAALFDRIPFAVAEQHRCVPFSYDTANDMLEVAFANPHDRSALHAVSGAVHPTRIEPYVAVAMKIREVLAAHRRVRQPIAKSSESTHQMDGLIDLLELAMASGHDSATHGMVNSAWVSRLATDIATRMDVSPDQRRKLRLAALVSDMAEWRHSSPGRPRSEIIDRSSAVLRDLDLPWDVVALLEACTREKNSDGTDDPDESILRVAWAIADTMPDNDDDTTLEQWEKSLREDAGNGLSVEVMKTAFAVLRVRSLRRRLSEHAPEIVVIGDGAFADELLDSLRDERYRVANAQSWPEGVVLLERRCPDLVCVVESDSSIPPPLVMEGQVAELGIDPSSVVVIASQRSDAEAHILESDGSMIVTDESAGVRGVMRRIRESLPGRAGDPKSSGATGGRQPDPSVAGRLADLGLPDLVQVLSSGHKSAQVLLTQAHRQGSIWFDRGRIVAARTDRLRGEEAFFDLLTWTEGRFAVHTMKRVRDRNISMQTTALLLEGFRRMDESRRAESHASPPGIPTTS